jgi:predicted dehydrogenase
MKIATIGSGMIVHGFLDAVSRVEGAECIAVYSRKEKIAKLLAEKFEVEHIYTNLDEMFLDPNIEVIYIASPNSLHYEQALKALNAKKNVILEKPFTSNYKQAAHLANVAKENCLMIFEAITTRHMPNYQIVKDNLDKIGRIRLVQTNYSQYSSKYGALLEGERPNVFNVQFSGGALMDINLYNLHFILGLFGTPETVKYFPNTHENGIDTSGIAVLKYPDFLAQAVGAKDSNSMNFAQIQGEKGYIHVVGGSNGVKEVEIVMNDGSSEILNHQTEENRLVYELQEFVRIFNKEDHNSSYQLLDESLQLMQVLDSLREDGDIVFTSD